MPRIWRICSERFQATPFDGEGAHRFGGRFNSVGTRIVYTAESPALAMFELLVHLDSYADLEGHVLMAADAAADLIDEPAPADLPPDWRAVPVPRHVQAVGDEWVASGSSLILKVPSVVVPHSWNYLVNPEHTDFHRVTVHAPEMLDVDPRLVK